MSSHPPPNELNASQMQPAVECNQVSVGQLCRMQTAVEGLRLRRVLRPRDRTAYLGERIRSRGSAGCGTLFAKQSGGRSLVTKIIAATTVRLPHSLTKPLHMSGEGAAACPQNRLKGGSGWVDFQVRGEHTHDTRGSLTRTKGAGHLVDATPAAERSTSSLYLFALAYEFPGRISRFPPRGGFAPSNPQFALQRA
jgi:hypothetical protein